MGWSEVLHCVFTIELGTSAMMSGSLGFWGLFMPYMVKTEQDTTWGLYWWCNTAEKPYTFHFIHAGDSPAYMEVARFCAALSPLMMLASPFITTYAPPDSATARWLIKLAVTWLPSLNVVAVLSLVATQYTYDDRWKDSSPSLGFCFWMIAGGAALNLPFTCFIFFIGIVEFIRVQERNRKLRRWRQGIQGQEQPPCRDSESTCNHACKTKVTFLPEKISCVTVKVRQLWTRFSEAVIKRLKGDHSGAAKKHEVKSVCQKDEPPKVFGSGDIPKNNPVADPAADVVSSEVVSTTNHELGQVAVHCLPVRKSKTARFVFKLRRLED